MALALAGCGLADRLRPVPNSGPEWTPTVRTAPPAVEAAPAPAPVLGEGVSAAALDTTTPAEKAAALAAPAPAGARALGPTVVALGSPADPGLWVQAPGVTAPGKGRVEVAGGKSLAVELRPGTGPAQMSLAAFQALGLPLTGLPEVTLFAE
jgi:hypothetical protein